MKRKNHGQAVLGFSAGVALILAQIYGCSGGDNNASPSDKPPIVSGGAGGSGSAKGGRGGSGAVSNGGEANTDGGTSNSGGAGNDTGTGGDDGQGGAPPDNGCDPEETDEGCWICPEESVQFLNQCTDSQCSPFVNDKAHLPLLNDDGTLPDLP